MSNGCYGEGRGGRVAGRGLLSLTTMAVVSTPRSASSCDVISRMSMGQPILNSSAVMVPFISRSQYLHEE